MDNINFRGFADTVERRILQRLRPMLWSLVTKVLKPLLIACGVSMLLTALAMLFYIWLRSMILPKALIKENLHFDFEMEKPVARVNLFSPQHQWYYASDGDHWESLKLEPAQTALSEVNKAVAMRRRFLKPRTPYAIDAVVHLSKSPRNVEMGKFMMRMDLLNSAAQLVAKSSRPVPVPYHTGITIALESIFLFPLKLFEFSAPVETDAVTVQLMNDFTEPHGATFPTQYLEFQLSTQHVDIVSAQVTMMPALSGLSYLMYYYPRSCFLAGTFIIFWMEVFALGIAYVAREIYNSEDMVAARDPSLARRNIERREEMRQRRGVVPAAPAAGIPVAGPVRRNFDEGREAGRAHQDEGVEGVVRAAGGGQVGNREEKRSAPDKRREISPAGWRVSASSRPLTGTNGRDRVDENVVERLVARGAHDPTRLPSSLEVQFLRVTSSKSRSAGGVQAEERSASEGRLAMGRSIHDEGVVDVPPPRSNSVGGAGRRMVLSEETRVEELQGLRRRGRAGRFDE